MTEDELRAVVHFLVPERKAYLVKSLSGQSVFELKWGTAYVVKNVTVHVNGLRAFPEFDYSLEETAGQRFVRFKHSWSANDHVLIEADVVHILELMAAVSVVTQSSP